MIEMPASEEDADKVEVIYGPNIKPFPKTEKLPESIEAKALLKVGDDITTDHIMPAGAKILPYRSNIPYLSQFCFGVCDKEFPDRCKKEGKVIADTAAVSGLTRYIPASAVPERPSKFLLNVMREMPFELGD